MSHGQNDDSRTIKSITRHIAAIAKVNHPFPVPLRHVLNGPTNLRLKPQYLQSVGDRLCNSPGGKRIFLPQEFT